MAGGWKSRNRKKQDGMQAGACADGALSQPRVAGALPASEVASCRAEAESLAEEAAAGGSGECLAAKVQELQRRIEALEGAATARPYPQEQVGMPPSCPESWTWKGKTCLGIVQASLCS